jgi:hypothetical protein
MTRWIIKLKGREICSNEKNNQFFNRFLSFSFQKISEFFKQFFFCKVILAKEIDAIEFEVFQRKV